jgi:FkbM family methyltransferase
VDKPLAQDQSTPLWNWLRRTAKVRTLIDIGANIGDYAEFMARFLSVQKTYAFEPLPSCLASLQAKRATIPDLKIFNVALADRPGKKVLYHNGYDPASSLLRVTDLSKHLFPQTAVETPVPVEVTTLDRALAGEELPGEIMVKMDVQGLEDKVIRGGRKTFARAKYVLVEMSFQPMYQAQPLFEEVHTLLVRRGLRFAGIKNQIHSHTSEQPLFAHCIYVRPPVPVRQKLDFPGRWILGNVRRFARRLVPWKRSA